MAEDNKGQKKSFAEWMNGRNGSDALGICVLVIVFILVGINLFVRSMVLTAFALLLAAYVFWRAFSRDTEARETENIVFLDFMSPILPWLKNPVSAGKELKQYKHLTCTECGQRVRVPRKKGKIRITCPKCGAKFEAKS